MRYLYPKVEAVQSECSHEKRGSEEIVKKKRKENKREKFSFRRWDELYVPSQMNMTMGMMVGIRVADSP